MMPGEDQGLGLDLTKTKLFLITFSLITTLRLSLITIQVLFKEGEKRYETHLDLES